MKSTRRRKKNRDEALSLGKRRSILASVWRGNLENDAATGVRVRRHRPRSVRSRFRPFGWDCWVLTSTRWAWSKLTIAGAITEAKCGRDLSTSSTFIDAVVVGVCVCAGSRGTFLLVGAGRSLEREAGHRIQALEPPGRSSMALVGLSRVHEAASPMRLTRRQKKSP